eukprot:TRINITY_DN2545_c0_g1_i1.p1 TRINITY_DN2545_c0_g1~~TRINITY_DN2545_c0_g1_i1.p1  ORF type:complete len:337 (-),score=99.26 TRINITY_DN2545_c0_g1_i1:61-1071(-)
MAPQRTEYPEKKVNYFKQMNQLLDDHNKIMVVGVENVQSQQFHQIRASLRGKATILLGKNTMMLRVLSQRLEERGTPRDQLLHDKLAGDQKGKSATVKNRLIQGNVGLVFTNGDLREIKDIMDKNKVQAPARAGTIAPIEVVVPAGNTGLEPTKTSFFQALNIGTKITKGTVEILKDEKILKVGDKVGNSEAALLQMLGIKPFFYGLTIEKVYDNGSVYGAEVLSLTDEDLAAKFQAGVANLTAFSLGLGYTTKASFPHVVTNAFKNLLALSISTDYVFPEFGAADLRKAILEGRAIGGAAAAPAASAAPAAADKPKKEEKVEEEEDEEMGFGLFD